MWPPPPLKIWHVVFQYNFHKQKGRKELRVVINYLSQKILLSPSSVPNILYTTAGYNLPYFYFSLLWKMQFSSSYGTRSATFLLPPLLLLLLLLHIRLFIVIFVLAVPFLGFSAAFCGTVNCWATLLLLLLLLSSRKRRKNPAFFLSRLDHDSTI